MRGMSDESYLRAIDGLCYHGELLSDCLPLPCLTWTEVAPCVARFSPLAPSQFSGLIFKIEALQHHPPTYGPGPPPPQRLSRSKHFTVRAGSAARCTSSFPLARAVDQRVRLNHSARRAEVRKRRRSTSALAVTILSHNLTNFLRTAVWSAVTRSRYCEQKRLSSSHSSERALEGPDRQLPTAPCFSS